MSVLGVSPGEHSAELPCVEANLEALLRFAGVKDVLTVLGGPLHPVRRDEWIERCTGLTLGRYSGDLAASIAGGIPVLVYADAFTVPWNPFAGHEHHEHAFVVDGCDGDQHHVVDCYTNVTRYGRAEPRELWHDLDGVTTLHIERLLGTVHEPDVDPREIVAANLRDHGELPTATDDLAALSLSIWLLTRSRALHARWWQRLQASEVDAAAEVVLAKWQSVQTISYLAWRRVEAGHPVPPTLPAALDAVAAAEADWFATMERWLGDG